MGPRSFTEQGEKVETARWAGGRYRILYSHDYEYGEWDAAARYADELAAEIQAAVPGAKVEVTRPLPPTVPDETTGGGEELHDVILLIDLAAAAIGIYTGLPVVVRQLRAAADRLAGRGELRGIDEAAAEAVAIDYAARPGRFAEIELRETVRLWSPREQPDEYVPNAYLVRLSVNGRDRMVVVGRDAHVIGTDLDPEEE